MLRAGPLSDAGIQERLRRDFVTSWILAKHLPRLAREASDPFVRSLAARAQESYAYPVDSQVYSPEGEMLDHVGANELSPDASARYHELLDAAGRAVPSAGTPGRREAGGDRLPACDDRGHR